MRKGYIIILAAAILVLVGAFYSFSFSEKKENNNGSDQNGKTEIPADWEKHENDKYGFSLQHPPQWSITSTTTEIASILVLAKEDSITAEELGGRDRKLNPNVTHIAIYPEALHTDGVLGRTTTSSVEIKPSTKEADDYLLENGERWASYFNFQKVPKNWDPAGFIWAAVEVKDLETGCRRDGEVISQEECDPMTSDDRIARKGNIDAKEKETIKKILSTFEFTEKVDLGKVHELTPASQTESIKVEEPKENASIDSPLTIKGEARGSWFFEGEFSAELISRNGNTLAITGLRTSSDWMTEDFVPFEGELEFEDPGSGKGNLLLKKANPSGLKENKETVSVPINF